MEKESYVTEMRTNEGALTLQKVTTSQSQRDIAIAFVLLSGNSSPSLLHPAMSKRQAILKLIWSPITAVFRTKHCAATASNLIVVKAGGEITGSGHDDAIVTKKARSSLEDLLKIEASSNPDTKAADEPEPHMAPLKSSSKESELQIVVALPENSTAAGRPPASLGGGAVLLGARTVRVKVNRLVVLVPAALRARSRAARTIDAALPTKRGGSYWRIAGRGGAGDKSEHFYQRPIPLGRRCRVQHLEGPYVV
ncbi:hypothetical protein E2562_014737 [Oryza meyeriana var. granulata]|uniref:Uncharacterized protein n=1 Tax=Oryza meyeriana var. granulata TaxID=110450 RepID=A0A6G1BLB8_9ORYZ|nr:hypothetical protein E2562_014737 [Oryza meyeriana var. granulata]